MNKKIQVLIVDDEAVLAETLGAIVGRLPEYEVEVFTDALEAFERLNKKRFDVISLDHRMPGKTGMQIVKELRTNSGLNQHTPILMFTALLDEAEQLHTDLLDNVLFLEKPLSDESYLRNLKFAYAMKLKITKKLC